MKPYLVAILILGAISAIVFGVFGCSDSPPPPYYINQPVEDKNTAIAVAQDWMEHQQRNEVFILDPLYAKVGLPENYEEMLEEIDKYYDFTDDELGELDELAVSLLILRLETARASNNGYKVVWIARIHDSDADYCPYKNSGLGIVRKGRQGGEDTKAPFWVLSCQGAPAYIVFKDNGFVMEI